MIEHVWKTGDPWMAGGAVVLLLAVGCGDGSPTAPTSTRATVTASCNPCEVFVGGESILRTDASDPDGDRLTYRWTATAGVFWLGEIGPTTSWRAPNQPGSVSISVTVTDGRGGSASDTVTIQVSALPTRPVDARFNDQFWRELVFFQFDVPGSIDRYRTRVLETTSPNFYIRMGDATGRRVVSIGQRDHMRRVIPQLAEQLTGEPYRGRIEDGIADRPDRGGWITVRFITPEEEPGIAEGSCGRASGGFGRIWIVRRKDCALERNFPELFAHEFGHAFGFGHVADRSALMARGWTGTDRFTAREVYHARLAYEVGRGQRYCGWPFSPTCFSRTALGAPFHMGPPIIVID